MPGKYFSTQHGLGCARSDNASLVNPAAEGNYIDVVNNDTERALTKTSYGFSIESFAAAVPSTVYPVTNMTTDGLNYAINQARINGGGIVRIPAGTINISSTINVPSRILLEGAGQTATKLIFTGTRSYVLFANNAEHVAIRDMEIDGRTVAFQAIKADYIDNLLIERTHAHHVNGSVIGPRYVDGGTLRYCNLHHTAPNDKDIWHWHAIGWKDIYESWADIGGALYATYAASLAQYESTHGSNPHGTLRSQNVVIQNNTVSSAYHGINYHGTKAEIVGNVTRTLFNKTVDGLELDIHHNDIDNATWGWMLGNSFNWSTGATETSVGKITIAQNKFGPHSSYAIALFTNASLPDKEWLYYIYLGNNEYAANATIRNQPDLDSTLFKVCGNDASVSVTGGQPGTLSPCPDYEDGPITGGSITASFTIDDDSGVGPHEVTFTDTSSATGTIAAWKWEYSRSGGSWVQFSTAEDPTYTFGQIGAYTIRLTVTSEDGTDSATDTVTVTAETTSDLISNGEFDSDLTDWSTSQGSGTASYSVVSGEAVANVTTGSSSTRLYQDGLNLVSGQDYTLKFDVRASRTLTTLKVRSKTSGGTISGLNVTSHSLTTSTQSFEHDFTCTNSDADSEIEFVFENGNAAIYYIDNVELLTTTPVGDPCDSTLIANGNFASALTSWSTYTNGAVSFSGASGAAVIDIVNASSNTQLYQYGLSITSGVEYVVRFTASANTNCSIDLDLIKHAADYNNCGLNETVALTPSPTEFEYRFFATRTEASARLRFFMPGLSNVEITIDNVCLAPWFEPSGGDPVQELRVIGQPLRSGFRSGMSR